MHGAGEMSAGIVQCPAGFEEMTERTSKSNKTTWETVRKKVQFNPLKFLKEIK